MTGTTPTPDQLALLRAVDNREIQLSALRKPSGSWHSDTDVTGPINILSRKGWIEPGEPDSIVGRWWCWWQPTAAGKAVLAAHPTPVLP